jgi:hypothetical protein
MICDCCRRHVDQVSGSFWLGDARLCGECFSKWRDPDCDLICTPDLASIGNYVRLKHGLPPLAAALAILVLAMTSTAQASRRCLDQAEAGRTWPTRILAQDGDGCWTYDHHPPAAEAPASMPDTVMPVRQPMLMDRWPDENLLWIELRELEPDPVAQPKPELAATTRQFALMVSLVLATWSVIEVTTGLWNRKSIARPRLWSRQTQITRKTPIGQTGRSELR